MFKTKHKVCGATIDLYATGIKGGQAPARRNLSSASIELGDYTLEFNAFKDGSRLKQCEITLTDKGETLFKGSTDDFVNKLS